MVYSTKSQALRRQAHYDKEFADFCQHGLQDEMVPVAALSAVTINFYLQATEKALKAMAAECREPVRNTHAVIDELVGREPASRARFVLHRIVPPRVIGELRVFQRLVPQGDDESMPNVEYPFGRGASWRIPAEHFDASTAKKAARVCGFVFQTMDEYIRTGTVGKLQPSASVEIGFRSALLGKLVPGRRK